MAGRHHLPRRRRRDHLGGGADPGAEGPRLALVLPYGSRLATSRINFRLLAREALTHEKRLSIVAGDPATRALAASAGLPVFATVGEYEAAMVGRRRRRTATGDDGAGRARRRPRPRRRTASRAERRSSAGPAIEPARGSRDADQADVADGTPGLVVPAAAVGPRRRGPPGDTIRAPVHVATGVRATRAAPTAAARPRRAADPGSGRRPTDRSAARDGVRTPWLVGGAILALVLLVGGVGAYLLLPSATIVVTPQDGAVGPIGMTIVADPTATEPDADAGSCRPSGDLDPGRGQRHVPATGKRVEQTKATGAVRFENLDPTSTNTIPAGSIVSTAVGRPVPDRRDGHRAARRARRADRLPGPCQVKVTAVERRPEGNVEPNTITVIPSGENPILLKVTNPRPDERRQPRGVHEGHPGGRRRGPGGARTWPLAGGVRGGVADPASAPRARRSSRRPGRSASRRPTSTRPTLVDQEVATFDARPDRDRDGHRGRRRAGQRDRRDAAARQRSTAGHELVEDRDRGRGRRGRRHRARGQLPGRPPRRRRSRSSTRPAQGDGPRQAARRGPVDPRAVRRRSSSTLWPDWVTTIPTLESRVELTVDQAVPIETPDRSTAATPRRPDADRPRVAARDATARDRPRGAPDRPRAGRRRRVARPAAETLRRGRDARRRRGGAARAHRCAGRRRARRRAAARGGGRGGPQAALTRPGRRRSAAARSAGHRSATSA